MPKNRAVWTILECAFYLTIVYLILELFIFRTETPQEKSSQNSGQARFNSINIEAEL